MKTTLVKIDEIARFAEHPVRGYVRVPTTTTHIVVDEDGDIVAFDSEPSAFKKPGFSGWWHRDQKPKHRVLALNRNYNLIIPGWNKWIWEIPAIDEHTAEHNHNTGTERHALRAAYFAGYDKAYELFGYSAPHKSFDAWYAEWSEA